MLKHRANQRGVTLVELLVGVVVGLLVILGAIAIYVGTSKGGREVILANRYNQDMRAVMDIMVSDLRRAGYSESNLTTGANPFTANTTDLRISADRSCILFAYDTTWRSPNAAGVPEAGIDYGGFRLQDGAVQAVRSTTMNSTAVDCDNLAWEDLTDRRVIRVTELRFDLLGSECLSDAATSYNPASSPAFSWAVATDSVVPPCDPTHPDAADPYPPVTNVFTEVRRVNIRLVAQSTATNALARAPLVESVIVRNHRVLLP